MGWVFAFAADAPDWGALSTRRLVGAARSFISITQGLRAFCQLLYQQSAWGKLSRDARGQSQDKRQQTCCFTMRKEREKKKSRAAKTVQAVLQTQSPPIFAVQQHFHLYWTGSILGSTITFNRGSSALRVSKAGRSCLLQAGHAPYVCMEAVSATLKPLNCKPSQPVSTAYCGFSICVVNVGHSCLLVRLPAALNSWVQDGSFQLACSARRRHGSTAAVHVHDATEVEE